MSHEARRDDSASHLVRSWRDHGYAVVRGVLAPAQVARLREIAEPIIARSRDQDPVNGRGGGDDARELTHPNHPGFHPDDRRDLVDLLAIAASEPMLAVPRALLGEEPLFRCLKLWFNPLLSSVDGHWHRDTQFLYPELAEERAVFDRMVGESATGAQFQVALVPSDDIEVVPGSHRRWDSPVEMAIRRAQGEAQQSNGMPGALRVALEPGDGVIFDAKMLHRGRYHAARPRRTLMLTTSTLNARRDDFFTRQPWFLESGYLDGLPPRQRAFYERFVEQFSPAWASVAAGRA